MSGSLLPNITRVSLGDPLFAAFGSGGGGGNPNPSFSTITVASTATFQGDIDGANINLSGGVTASTITAPQITGVSTLGGAVLNVSSINVGSGGPVLNSAGLTLSGGGVFSASQVSTLALNVSSINSAAYPPAATIPSTLGVDTLNVSTINCNQTVNAAVGAYSTSLSAPSVLVSSINGNFNIEDSFFPARNPNWLAGTGVAVIPAASQSTIINAFPTTSGHTYRLSCEIGFQSANTAALGVTQLFVNNGSSDYAMTTIPNVEADSTYLNLFGTYSCVFTGGSSFSLIGSNTAAAQVTLNNNHAGECVLEDLGKVVY